MTLLAAIAAASLLLAAVLIVFDDPFYRRVAPVAFLFHLAVGLAVVPSVPYVWDVDVFHEAAIDLLEGLHPDASEKVVAFATFQAFLYFVFEPAIDVLVVFNALFATLVAIPAAYLARRLYPSTRTTNGVTLLVLFLPLPAFFTSVPMRDTFALLLTFCALALLVGSVLDRSIRSATASLPLLGILALIRVEVALLLALGAITGVVVRSISRVSDRDVSISTLGLVALPTGLLGFALFGRYLPLWRLNAGREFRTQGEAVFLEGLTYDSWVDVALSVPAASLYFQFAPFPLHVESAAHVPAAAYTPVVIVLAVSAVRSLRRCETVTAAAVLLGTVYLGGIVGYGLVNANFGTTTRHRILFDFLLVVFAAPVLERWERSLRERVGEWPRDEDDDDEQDGETREPYARAQVGPQNPDDAHRYDEEDE